MSLKILLLSHKFYPDVGGIETNSEVLANYFYSAGKEIKVVTWTQDTGKKEFPFPIIRNPNISTLLKEFLWAEIILENNPSLRLSWPAMIIRKPSVVAINTWIHPADKVPDLINKLKFFRLKNASAVIAVSEAIRKRCWPAATVIGNPYSQHLFRLVPSIPKTVLFVFLGRLVSDKGANIAINALHKLTRSTHPSIRNKKLSLTIIGEGEDKGALEDLAKALNIVENITFTGKLYGESLVECLNKHLYMIVPSIWEEPFGNVVLEGMACGCLPIVSDGGGLPDAVGNAGLIFQRGNVNDLVECIEKLFSDPILEQKIRERAPAHLINHYSEKISSQYLHILEKFSNHN